MGFSKGMAAFGGGILCTFLFCHFLVYADIKDHEKKTIHHVSSYLIMCHLFKSSNQVEILNLAETGGSKYGVPQGYGCISTCVQVREKHPVA